MLLNSHDEWPPLKKIIVGSATNYISHERELSFDLIFHDNVIHSEWAYPRLSVRSGEERQESFPIKKHFLEELQEDIEGIVQALQGLGISVLHPLEMDAGTSEVRTPAFSASVVTPLNLRDNTVNVGHEIIETPPMGRSRDFETQFLTPVFHEYFRRGARWTVMPRPLMTEVSAAGPGHHREHLHGQPRPRSRLAEAPPGGSVPFPPGAQLSNSHIDSILSVSPNPVLVNEARPELIRTLEQQKFTVVPVRHRHRRLFGGGFHCFTLDTVREGSPEDYLD